MKQAVKDINLANISPYTWQNEHTFNMAFEISLDMKEKHKI